MKKKFLVLYYAPNSMEAMEKMKKMTPEEHKEGMKPWLDWKDECGDAVLDFGGPLGDIKKITSSGVFKSNNEVSGYSIIQANSIDKANDIMSSNPHLKMGGCYVDVCEIMSM
ncbi:MAG: hypothetical protein QM490_00270 [Candidatus Gracilibacteria bacterium]